jgi:prepilin peptidase CpaA
MTGQEIAHMNTGLVILFAALFAASLTDIAHRRIPNVITYPLAACGLVFHFASAGTNGLIFALTGIIAGATMLLPFYLMGGMGAGDVKLMAASGSILGPAGIFTAALYSALAGGLYALLVLWRHGAVREAFYGLMPVQNTSTAAKTQLPRLCYGVAISLGTVLAVLRPI